MLEFFKKRTKRIVERDIRRLEKSLKYAEEDCHKLFHKYYGKKKTPITDMEFLDMYNYYLGIILETIQKAKEGSWPEGFLPFQW